VIRLFAGVGKDKDGNKLPPIEVPSEARVGGQELVLVARPVAGRTAAAAKPKPAKGR
jgi:hypothetical protein